MNVVAVADDLCLDISVLHCGGDNTGIAMVDTGHGVVQVGHMGGTGIKSGLGIVIAGIGVGYGYGAEFFCLGHKFCGTGQFGSHVHNADQALAAVVQGLEAFKVGLLQIVGILSATLLVGEVGAFHLDAHEPGETLRRFLCQLQGGGKGLFQNIIGKGHGGGGEGGDAAFCVVGGHGLQTLIIAVGEVRTGVAVAMDFHQTGDDGGTLQIDGIIRYVFRENGPKQAVFHLKSAGMKLKIGGENAGIFVEHNRISFFCFFCALYVGADVCIGPRYGVMNRNTLGKCVGFCVGSMWASTPSECALYFLSSGRLAAATDWPTRRVFSSGSMTCTCS